jgi:hypothetical protein
MSAFHIDAQHITTRVEHPIATRWRIKYRSVRNHLNVDRRRILECAIPLDRKQVTF